MKQLEMYEIARKELMKGIYENPGKTNAQSHPRIIEYIKSVTAFMKPEFWNDSTTAWCSAFVNWCAEQAGVKGTESGLARSWLNWGHRIKTPQVGDIVVFSRGNNKIYGHVGFFVGYSDLGVMIRVLGGNQSNGVTIAKYPRWRLLGFRRASENFKQPPTPPAA